jgi:hypothetical protein
MNAGLGCRGARQAGDLPARGLWRMLAGPCPKFAAAALLAFLSLLVLVLPQAIAASPAAGPPGLAEARDWQRLGSGEMRRLGFELYRATLWVPPAAAAPESALDHGRYAVAEFALVLQYRRSIPARRLAEASIDEMRRLGVPEQALRRWEGELLRVFRDVGEGDTITGVHRPGVGASFFHGGRHTGDVDDPEFAQHFFAIWLDPRTSAPKLRAALLRLPPAAGGGRG